jgi:hypothetical protein
MNIRWPTLWFLPVGRSALLPSRGGHLIFDAIFDAGPTIEGVKFGPFLRFAITHRGDLSPRREFTISSAGFWMQDLSSEWLLTKQPRLRDAHAPVARAARVQRAELDRLRVLWRSPAPARSRRDTRGMAQSIGVDERAIGALVLAPAVFDAIRYFKTRRRGGRSGPRERRRWDRCCW